jgi:hypothetical protein
MAEAALLAQAAGAGVAVVAVGVYELAGGEDGLLVAL